jgi:tetratricopeptide (TPR) repeat protein
MAQTIRAEQVTPADELRELLALAEKRLANVRGGGDAMLSLLRELDRIAELWPLLEAQGMDLRPEAGRWTTVQRSVDQKAGRILRELKGLGGIEKLRETEHPGGAPGFWWHLDSRVRERNREATKRAALTTGLVIFFAVGLYFLLFRVLFRPDPLVQESVRRVSQGEQWVQEDGDFAAALPEFEAAAAATPDDPQVWMRVGIAREQLGDTQGAEDAFERARSLSGTELDYFRGAGAAYLALGLVEPAERDLRAALALKNDDAQSWYLMANIFESRRQISEAVDALGKASQYAEETNQSELTAMSRYRMGMLMQQLQFSQPTDPSGAPAPGTRDTGAPTP